ncbi:MAG: calcium-binding protein [Pseudomonadota bacterium]
MGGVTEPTTEPGIVTTAGNDTIIAGALLNNLDGLAGTDLIFLDYRNLDQYLDDKVYSLNLLAASGTTKPSVIAHYDPLVPNSPLVWTNFTITGFERIHFRASDMVQISISTGAGNDTLVGGALSDTLDGGEGADLIYGGTGHDYIFANGDQAQDSLYGGSGNDLFINVGLNDIADGGLGNDTLTADFSSSESGINDSITHLIQSSNWTGFESYELKLTNFDDVFTITESPLKLDGGAGNDLLIVDRTGLAAFYINMVYDKLPLNQPYGLPGVEPLQFEHLYFIGSDGNDTIGTTNANDTILGGGGADIIFLRAGAYLVSAGAGRDEILGVTLNDTIDGGDNFDIAVFDLTAASSGISMVVGQNNGNLSNIEAFGGKMTNFSDVITSGRLAFNLSGAGGTDTLVLDYSGTTALRTVFNFQNTVFDGVEEYNELNGGGSGARYQIKDWEIFSINGSEFRDDFKTGVGNDTLFGNGEFDVFNAGLGNNLLYGGADTDLFQTTIGAKDTIFGGSGDDHAYGIDFDDRVDGGAGADEVVASYADLSKAVTLTALGVGNMWSSIEQITATLTAYNDVVSLTGVSFFHIDAGAGEDVFSVDFSNLTAWLEVRNGQGVIHTTPYNYSVMETYNFERMQIIATAFGDRIVAGSGNDTLRGDGGADALWGGGGNDLLLGGTGSDTIYGDQNDDLIYGGDGIDFIFGGIENDTLSGGAGNDLVYSGQAADYITAEGGDDLVYGGLGYDTVLAGTGNDMIFGEAGSDFLIGAIGNDTIYGGDGLDRMNGGDGIDVLFGGADRDVMVGGAGADIFVFDAHLATGSDVIADYESIDTLYYRGLAGASDLHVVRGASDVVITWETGALTLIGAARLVVMSELGDLFG